MNQGLSTRCVHAGGLADAHGALPGRLPDFAGHALAKRQMSGFGGMLSIEVKGSGDDSYPVCAAPPVPRSTMVSNSFLWVAQ